MNISAQQVGDITVAKLDGELDAATVPVAEQRIQQLVAAGAVLIVLDMSGVTYMASAGIRLIHNLLREVRRRSGDLRLAGVQPQVKRTLDLIGLAPLLSLCDDVASALASFK